MRDNLPHVSRGELRSELLSSPCRLLLASLRSVLTLSSFSMLPGSLSQSCILRHRRLGSWGGKTNQRLTVWRAPCPWCSAGARAWVCSAAQTRSPGWGPAQTHRTAGNWEMIFRWNFFTILGLEVGIKIWFTGHVYCKKWEYWIEQNSLIKFYVIQRPSRCTRVFIEEFHLAFNISFDLNSLPISKPQNFHLINSQNAFIMK